MTWKGTNMIMALCLDLGHEVAAELVEGGLGVSFLAESDAGVAEQQDEDDNQVFPVFGNRGENGAEDDASGHHSVELLHEHCESAHPLLGELILTPLLEQLLRPSRAEAVHVLPVGGLRLRQA